MRFDDRTPGRLTLRDGETVLAEYVYEPDDARLESPRPYALLRTRGGREVTGIRPADHVWHKGLSLALPHVGAHNFWGGPTFVAGEGYVQLPNNGTQAHRSFEAPSTPRADAVAGDARIDERLDWVTEAGETVLTEKRRLTASPVDDDTWALAWSSALRSVSDTDLAFGSPATRGRADAGYAGILWRGPVDFTGGRILSPDGDVGEAARGTAVPWLAFISPDGDVGVLALDAAPAPSPWFARSAEYAGLAPAPFSVDETVLAPGETLTLGLVLLIGGPDVARHAPVAGANLVAATRAGAVS